MAKGKKQEDEEIPKSASRNGERLFESATLARTYMLPCDDGEQKGGMKDGSLDTLVKRRRKGNEKGKWKKEEMK